MSDSFPPQGLYSPWNSPGQNTWVGSLSLLRRSSTQGLNPGLPHCRWILHQLSHKGSPVIKCSDKRCNMGPIRLFTGVPCDLYLCAHCWNWWNEGWKDLENTLREETKGGNPAKLSSVCRSNQLICSDRQGFEKRNPRKPPESACSTSEKKN